MEPAEAVGRRAELHLHRENMVGKTGGGDMCMARGGKGIGFQETKWGRVGARFETFCA